MQSTYVIHDQPQSHLNSWPTMGNLDILKSHVLTFFNGMAVSFTSLSVIQFPYLARIRRKEQWMIKDYGIMSVMEMKYFCVAMLNILNHIEYIQYSHAKYFSSITDFMIKKILSTAIG